MKRCSLTHSRKFAAAALALLLLLAGCRATPPAEETPTGEAPAKPAAPAGQIAVPYTALDSLNPFYTESVINAQLIPLVFRSLYRLNGAYEPQADLAVSGTESALRVQVTVAADAVFSDGVALTAKDVQYSFEKAKNAPLYAAALSGIERCETAGTTEAVFYLTNEDPNILNVLTFPIAKQGTASNEDSLPIGAGPFAYESETGGAALVFNERAEPPYPAVGAIALQNVTESASLMHLLDSGVIDCFFTDLSEGAAKRTAGGSTEVYLNNLVFLGVNHDSYLLGNPEVRRAVSLALSRGRLCADAFLNHARAAFSPYNTSWAGLQGAQSVMRDTDAAAAEKLLQPFNAGPKGETLSYRLVYETDGAYAADAARIIASQLAAVNITAEPVGLQREQYLAALGAGEFDLYLGEVKLPDNMDLSVFFTEEGAARYGMRGIELRSDSAFALCRSGQSKPGDLLAVFSEEMPFIPLLFRNGQFCYATRITGVKEATRADPYYSVTEWEVAQDG